MDNNQVFYDGRIIDMANISIEELEGYYNKVKTEKEETIKKVNELIKKAII